MRSQWACPDLGAKKPDGLYNPIPGSSEQFDDCPAFYLRTAGNGMNAPHLIDGHTHPAQLVGQWAFEVESGSRNVESLSPKAIELVHMHLRERRSRDDYAAEKRKAAR
jgi:hypothetical protein